MKIQISKTASDSDQFGSKAKWLSWLQEHKYNVPKCFFISIAGEVNEKSLFDYLKSNNDFQEYLETFKNKERFSLAIRSSSKSEDTSLQSNAGQFKTFLGNFTYLETIENIYAVYKDIENNSEDEQIGIIIQQMIRSKFSGVSFSSDPISHSKQKLIISVTEGMGDQLVSGKVAGEDIFVEYQNEIINIPDYQSKIYEGQILGLVKISKKIENTLGFPVDIEWCIDTRQIIHILQCRPITTINLKHKGVFKICQENYNKFPSFVQKNDKIQIRLIAEKNQIDISNAYLVVYSAKDDIKLEDFDNIIPDSRCVSYSTVLLFPKLIDGNVIRAFSSEQVEKQHSAYRTCTRYSFRSYGNNTNLISSIREIRKKCCSISWNCVIIIQEIFSPKYTGIAKMLDKQLIIEIGKGHFIPKGVVSTSQYILENHQIVFKKEIEQKYWYDINNGEVIKKQETNKVSVTENQLKHILDCLFPVLNNKQQTVEFGLLDAENLLNPYLIDLADDDANELSRNLISSGVISKGIISGKKEVISLSDNSQSLELHLHNNHDFKDVKLDQPTIFICDTPDIGLMELLNKYRHDKIGFVFKQGSVLSHFSIILREKEIPAVVYKSSLKNMNFIKIDASNEKLKSDQRVFELKCAVTSYTNPDTDGVIGSIVYGLLNTSFEPIHFGDFDNETKFILNHFKIPYPKKDIDLIDYDEIALIDTHNIDQLSEKVPSERVLEVIDHHQDGNSDDFPNASIQNEKVGAACTLIAERMKERNINPTATIASILSLAIYSNTLNLTAPSTHIRDYRMLEWLSNFHPFLEEVKEQMFEARSNISTVSTEEILDKNTKIFRFSDVSVGISQLESSQIESFISRKDIKQEMLKIKDAKGLDYYLFSGVDFIKKNTSILWVDNSEKKILSEIFNQPFSDDYYLHDKILLRKTDYVPKLKKLFE